MARTRITALERRINGGNALEVRRAKVITVYNVSEEGERLGWNSGAVLDGSRWNWYQDEDEFRTAADAARRKDD